MSLMANLRNLHDNWKPVAAAAVAVLSIAWIGITTAEEVLRASQEVPEIKVEQEQIRQSLNELGLQQRLTQQQVDMLSTQVQANDSLILQRLDRLLERPR